ncbi:hypothetical protein CN918_29610 [Priestia megaterium]|nr:hypothetical protein CN918_29610 [Priestia megaterium]
MKKMPLVTCIVLISVCLLGCENVRKENADKEEVKREKGLKKETSTSESQGNSGIVAEDVSWNGTYKRGAENDEGTLTFSNVDENTVDFALDASKTTENGLSMAAMNDQATISGTKATYIDEDSKCIITFGHVGNQVVVSTTNCEDENDGSSSPYDGSYIRQLTVHD